MEQLRKLQADLPNFYPRSPRGERLPWCKRPPALHQISIHAPREGSDAHGFKGGDVGGGISIHAPREGSDMIEAFTF